MGVPKFFRYISERYPCLSELVKEHQIPDFDNLYLDMNGIIHMCSHPDDYDPHFRISEEKMFGDIFHYIEVLFRMIKPQRLFFMAVDGVAPRAKMNQQRGRRFRSAKEAEVLEAKAKERGEELPEEARFDSNCITPGTLFMARLHEQLKYFVSNKISTDKLWQKCKIILSGHETPGEGEHKIMDYIRYMKAQPGYDPNTRHCLYGLDADLIMLGLCTHEPHFSLLREEVRFGKKSKRKNIPEQITFFLLHLSLMREYLELEFLPLKDTLPFEYDMEKIIDDWVLMGFLVGNDFIPHLPNLHIASGALPVLYNAYMKILPTLDGYINEAGQLSLDRFEKFMSALGSVDMDHFSEQYADLKYFHGKTGRNPNTKERTSYKPKQLEVWQPDECDSEVIDNKAEAKTTNKELAALIKSTDDMLLDDFLKNKPDDETTEIKLLSNPELFVTAKVDDLLTGEVTETTSLTTSDSNLLVDIFGTEDKKSEEPVSEEEKIKTENLVLLEPSESNLADLALDDIELHDDEDATSPYYSESDTEEEELMNAEFIQHKNDYYMNKLDYSKVTPEVLRDQAEGYVRAIQWNLHYYYNGVCSWSWYYPHHYAPYISDIKGFADLKLEYELCTPFRSFEQLLAVLPAASKVLLPEPYQELMTSENSPIIDFYPQEFRTDLNGKKQEWEAVVLIPFIDEIALLEAMAKCNERLTEEEAKRNSHGPMLVYEYCEDDLGNYDAPEYFPKIEINHAKLSPITIEEIRVPIEKLVKGPCPGSIHNVYYPGFPTLKHLKYTGQLEKAKVKVFDTPSQNDNMIIKIAPHEKNIDIEELARKLLGTSVHVAWPHLVEAQVVSVSDSGCRYHKTGVPGKFSLEVNKGNLNQLWHSQKSGITIFCKEKFGIDVGETTILAHVKIVTGQKYVSSNNAEVALQKQWADVESCYPLQAVVQNLVVYEVDNKIKTIQDLFPMGSKCFMIGHPHYGSIGEVTDNMSLKSGRIRVSMSVLPEPDLSTMCEFADKVKYMPGGAAAQRLAITPHLLSRITGSIFAIPGVKGNSVPKHSSKMNIGLNLKLNKRNEEIPGYTRKVDGQWLYSYNAVLLVRSYMEFCPDLFVYITSHLGNDVFYESELFPENIGEGKIQRIVDWIKKQPFSSVERQKVGSQTVEVEVIKKIEETLDKFYSLNPKPKQVVMQVKPHLLFKPEIQTGHLPPDSSAQYQLYDRVVHIRESYTAPFGCKGTVIGIQGQANNGEDDQEIMYDVLFDQTFAGGLQLNCSANRGYRVPKTALINITHGMRVVQQKTVNPATNNPWYGNVPMNQTNQQQPVQSQNSAFASWTPTPSNQNNYYRQQHPQQPQQHPQQSQQQQRMFQPPHRGMHPPPPFAHLMNHHQRMPAPASQQQQPTSGARPPNKSGVSAEFHAFLQDLQKNQGKGKHRTPPNSVSSVNPAPLRTPNLVQSGQAPVNQTRALSSSSNSSAQSAAGASVDPAESLKKLLNISGKLPAANQPSTSSVNNNSVSQPISVEDFFAHARTKEQKLAQTTNQSSNNPYYSVQLLNYCQAQRIGIPRYNYVPSSNNKVRAQISLPDGRMVIGDESASKEEATENAAKIIITDMLHINNDASARQPHRPNQYSGPRPVGFPIPPKQWCQRTQNLQRSHKQNQNLNFSKQQINGSQVQQIPMRKEPAKNEEGKSPGSTSFVPLQAVKQQRNKTGTNVGEGDDGKRKDQGAMGGNSSNKNATKKSGNSPVKNNNPQVQSSSNSPPKQRVRRSRIAANFSGLQQPK